MGIESQEEFLSRYESEDDDDSIKEEASEMEDRSSSIDPEKAERQAMAIYNEQLDSNLKENEVIPSIFSESVYLLDGRPLRFKNRDYLRLIYDANIENGLLMCGRQVEKSTTFSIKIANSTLLLPFSRSLYFAPLNEQVKVFSEDRLGRLFKYSQDDIIKKKLIDNKDKQNVFNKSFMNGSLIYLRHCFGTGDNIRGISVNNNFGDEIQDVDVDALPVIQETQAHARDLGPGTKTTWYSGTPKTYSNTIQHLWEDTTQCEWVVRCWSCNRDQVMGLDNITPTKYICRNNKCRQEITTFNIAKGGRWIKFNEKSKRWGFRITQMISPSMTAEDIYEKVRTYDNQRLNNEVFGRSYESADKPFTPVLMAQMFDNDKEMIPGVQGIFRNKPVYMGVDWGEGGKSFTVVGIFSWNSEGRFQMLYAKKYSTREEVVRENQVKDIAKLMNLFKVDYCITDYGHGFQANQQLKKMFGSRTDCMYYSHNKTKPREFDAKKNMWVVNRTKVIHEYVKACQELKIQFPGKSKEELEFVIDHHLAIQTEYRSKKSSRGSQNIIKTSSEEMYYSHPPSKPDDFVHVGVYAYSAFLAKPKGRTGDSIQFGGAYSR